MAESANRMMLMPRNTCFAHVFENVEAVAQVRFDERTVVPVCPEHLEMYEALDLEDPEVNVRVKEVLPL